MPLADGERVVIGASCSTSKRRGAFQRRSACVIPPYKITPTTTPISVNSPSDWGWHWV